MDMDMDMDMNMDMDIVMDMVMDTNVDMDIDIDILYQKWQQIEKTYVVIKNRFETTWATLEKNENSEFLRS